MQTFVYSIKPLTGHVPSLLRLQSFFFMPSLNFGDLFGRRHPNIKLLKAHWHFDFRVLILALSLSDLPCLCVLLLTLFIRHLLH